MSFRRSAISIVVTIGVALVGASCGGESATGKPKATKARELRPGEMKRVPGGYQGQMNDDAPTQEAYVPKEFASGADRWRDTGVYLDGKPIANLAWGELPLTLPVTWIEEKASAPKRYGHPEETGWKIVRERRYRFTDYLKALGVDIRRVKEIHVYGPRLKTSVIATGKDLQSKAAAEFTFRFGGDVTGKAIPGAPVGFGNGMLPDKIAGVMIYVDKQPPTFVRNEGFMLDDKLVDGVPYFGEPLRGGVRVYLDARQVAYIKRQDLPVGIAVKDASGELTWRLADVLAMQGVKLGEVVEGWVVRDEKREERIGAQDLATITFTAGSQAKGHILLGPRHIKAKSLMLHTKAADPKTFPKRQPDE